MTVGSSRTRCASMDIVAGSGMWEKYGFPWPWMCWGGRGRLEGGECWIGMLRSAGFGFATVICESGNVCIWVIRLFRAMNALQTSSLQPLPGLFAVNSQLALPECDTKICGGASEVMGRLEFLF
jgi:hypothetical protein